jgi:hypothetical protein
MRSSIDQAQVENSKKNLELYISLKDALKEVNQQQKRLDDEQEILAKIYTSSQLPSPTTPLSKIEQRNEDLNFELSVRKSILRQQNVCKNLLEQMMETQSHFLALT